MQDDSILVVMKEILNWTRASSFHSVKSLLQEALPDTKSRAAFQMLDGTKSMDQVRIACKMSPNGLQALTQKCVSMGLMETNSEKKRSRLFDLVDFGLIVESEPAEAGSKKMKVLKNKLEVSSDQLRAELIEIKERVGALETIASISNRVEVEKYIRLHLTNTQRKQILQECAEPRTRQHLKDKFSYATLQALDFHLKPLRDSDLIHQRFDDEGKPAFVQSKLVQGLPKTSLRKLFE